MSNYWLFLRFSLWILIEESIFLFKMPRRKYFWWRLIPAVAIICVGTLIVNLIWPLINLPAGISSFRFPLYCIFTLLAVFLCFNISFKQLLFIGTGAYTLQHLSISIANMFKIWFPAHSAAVEVIYEIVFGYIIYVGTAAVAYFFYVRGNDFYKNLQKRDIKQGILACVVLIANVYLSSVLSRDLRLPDTFDAVAAEYVNPVFQKVRLVQSTYSIITCCLIFSLQFTFLIKNKLQEDKEQIDRLFHIEKEQCDLSRKTIEIINMKCHDIKHMLTGLEDIDESEERKKHISGLKKEISIYDKKARTGSDALDVVIMEKGLLCESDNINFSYIADGERLKFMSTLDIYVLFGNALDNAIESVSKEEDVSKRSISLKVSMINNMLLVHLENYCPNKIEFDADGLPKTDKDDKNYHGFGTKSIKYITQKYDGDMSISVKDNRFVLDLLFSLISEKPDQSPVSEKIDL